MLKKISLCLALTASISVPVMSQQTAIYTNDFADYNRAMVLFENNQYKAAQTLFQKVEQEVSSLELKADCAYYIAICAVRLNQSNADALMEDFVNEHPTSTKRNSAYINVANYYFNNGDYNRARQWYEKVDTAGLSRAEQQEFNFNNGYAYFKAGRKEEAKTYFNRVRDSKEYGSQAKYYLGFIAYEGDNYQEANDMFEEVKGDGRLDKSLSYFQSDMNFKLGKFEKAIELGKAQLDRSNRLEKSELNKIIGESYFA